MRNVAVIMAGGSGTRLWPLSRQRRPKQFLRLFGGRSLIQLSYDRLRSLFAPGDIYVITLAEQLPIVAEELPDIPAENLIGEPAARDTANAVALSAAILHERNPDTVMGIFTADHVIRPVEQFARTVKYAFELAEKEPSLLVTFGIKPTHPHTGLGYIEIESQLRGAGTDHASYRVRAFHEKPAEPRAKEYIDSGRYFWNSGMFVWRTATVLDQLRQFLPESHEGATRVAQAWGGGRGPAVAAEVYPALKRISIDYAVLEKAQSIATVLMPVEWLDVGSWTALPSVLGADEHGNTAGAPVTMLQGAKNTIIAGEGDHLIAAIGVEDLVIVHSDDATLICRRDQAHRIREMVEQLKSFQDGRYL